MEHVFQNQLSAELLQSEKKRTVILITIFAFGACYQAFSHYFFWQIDQEAGLTRPLASLWTFPLAMIGMELIFLFYIKRKLWKGMQHIPTLVQYIHVTLEILLVSAIIVSVGYQFPSFGVLKSPAVFIYFLFIVVSTLKLNFGLSFVSGLLAAISYLCFSLFIDENFSSIEIIKSIIILFCGVIAGLVGRQIKAGIRRSYKEAEKRQKVENLFGQQISQEVAEKMIENDGKIESKRMNVAIMFIDIRNFTNYASNKNPEEIVQFQNVFFTTVFNAVSAHHGVVHQFLGDGCMVTFGAPLELDNPSQHAIRASFTLFASIEKEIKQTSLPDIKIGIGIHSGEVVTGNIGTAQRQQYSITGTVVILASRIEQLNKRFETKLLVSQNVMDNIHDNLLNQPEFLGKIDLKGWSTPVGIYKVA